MRCAAMFSLLVMVCSSGGAVRGQRGHSMPHDMTQLLERNRQWADGVDKYQPGFLKASYDQPQQPKYLWIGCSDSRVPETEIVNGVPGEIFVHRNIGGMINNKDRNLNAVLEYAINELKVTNILVVGHTKCGAVNGALTATPTPDAIDSSPASWVSRWIKPIVKLYRASRTELKGLTKQKKWDKMVQLNTLNNRRRLLKNPIVRRNRKKLNISVAAWVYDLSSGHILDLDQSEPTD